MKPLAASAKAYEMVAKLGYPEGGTGICYKCGKTREYTHEQVIKLLKKSLPLHCGRKIDLKPL